MKLPPPKRSNFRRALVGVLICLLAVLAAYIVYGDTLQSPAQTSDKVAVEETKASEQPKVKFAPLSEVPIRIVIDKIGVDASIEPVGLTPDGLMAAPNTNQLVGWYEQSAKAGEDKYAMLLDGHYGTDTEPAVFRQLVDLVPGDSIMVYGDKGSQLRYEVVESHQQLTEDVDMIKALYPYKDGEQSLTIITCEGEYDPINISYDKRTVLYAIRVD